MNKLGFHVLKRSIFNFFQSLTPVSGPRPAGDGPTRVRAIAVSGNADDPGFHHEAMTAGFDDAIAKPLTHARAQAMLAIGER